MTLRALYLPKESSQTSVQHSSLEMPSFAEACQTFNYLNARQWDQILAEWSLLFLSVSGILGIVLVLSLLYVFWRRKGRKTLTSGSSIDGHFTISYQSLLKATDGFSSTNLIGTGSFGSVYKGVLDSDQRVVAVKVLNLARHGASKSFIAECEALRNIRHRNLVKVLTACSGFDYRGNDFKALIYEFMFNGSLDEWLHPQTSGWREYAPRKLSLPQRVNIAIDIACAFDYLHHQSEIPIVHCDLKPSDILLDGEMNGHVGDFGLVRFLPEATQEFICDQTSSIGVRGSIGYIAPGNYLTLSESFPHSFLSPMSK